MVHNMRAVRILFYSSRRFWEIDEATIEGLAFGARPSREVDEVSRPRCLSTRQEKEASHVMK
ncbi:MAG: hypothetical protein GQ536_00805 [Candidatus Aminicenantes bacterium]|nr:hypothetical protein [Candidatus Aminicenantes bacterium]